MAWSVVGQTIQMVEGDYGIELPITINGTTLGEQDSIKITFKSGSDTILEKEFSNIVDNTVSLVLTEAESALFNVGNCSYSLDWYQDGLFMCNIIPSASFKVVGKA